MVSYRESPPPDRLAAFVQSLWAFSASGAPPSDVHHIPPDGCLSVVVTGTAAGGRAVVVGPHVRDLAVPVWDGARSRGVRMRPEAAGLLTGLDPRAWAGRVGPLAAASPALAARVEPLVGSLEEAFDAVLGALTVQAAIAPGPDPVVRSAVAAIVEAGGDLRVGDLARALGVSPRTLQRRFARATGLTPKPFARVRRFRRALTNMLRDDPDAWGRVAAEHGYADQAHLANDVAAIAGVSPGALHGRLGHIVHVDVRP